MKRPCFPHNVSQLARNFLPAARPPFTQAWVRLPDGDGVTPRDAIGLLRYARAWRLYHQLNHIRSVRRGDGWETADAHYAEANLLNARRLQRYLQRHPEARKR